MKITTSTLDMRRADQPCWSSGGSPRSSAILVQTCATASISRRTVRSRLQGRRVVIASLTTDAQKI
jgi:hypothetical protein